MCKSKELLNLIEDYEREYRRDPYLVIVNGYYENMSSLHLSINRKDEVTLLLNLYHVKDPDKEIKNLLPSLDKYFPKGIPQEIFEIKNINKPLIHFFDKKVVGLKDDKYSPWGKSYTKQWGVEVYFPWIKSSSQYLISGVQIPKTDSRYIFKDKKQGKEFIKSFGGYVFGVEI